MAHLEPTLYALGSVTYGDKQSTATPPSNAGSTKNTSTTTAMPLTVASGIWFGNLALLTLASGYSA